MQLPLYIYRAITCIQSDSQTVSQSVSVRMSVRLSYLFIAAITSVLLAMHPCILIMAAGEKHNTKHSTAQQHNTAQHNTAQQSNIMSEFNTQATNVVYRENSEHSRMYLPRQEYLYHDRNISITTGI